jgi:hypothetical protein
MQVLPEIRGGWLTFEPGLPSLRRRLHSAVAPDLAILVYGELFGVKDGETAGVIASQWRSGGAPAVRRLNGCFSCIVVDRRHGEVTLLTDTIGRRSLRYIRDGDSAAVATHDAALVATGMLSPQFNLAAIASAVAVDWSLGGASFLDGVTTMDPDEYLVWSGGRFERTDDRLSMAAGRLHHDRKAAVAEHISRITDVLVRGTAEFCGPSGPLKADLTAGVDTRTVLALLLAGVDRNRITAYTEGQQADDLDVLVAHRIARTYGLAHDVSLRKPPDPELFLAQLDVLAWSTNGDTDGKRALADIFRNAEFSDPTPRLCGHGALYRGPWYPPSGRNELLALRPEDVVGQFRRRFHRMESLPWREPEMRDRLNALLASRFERYARSADQPVDLHDLFFLYERYSRWGSLWARCSWWSHYFDPLSSNTVLRMGFQLPAPVSFGAPVNRAILARYLKRGYYLHLINGKGYGPALPFPVLTRRVNRALAMGRNARAAVVRRLHSGKSMKERSLDTWAATHFGGTIRRLAEETLLAPGGIASRIISEAGIRSMMADLEQSGSVPGGVGIMLSVERWRGQIEKVWNLSRARTLPS